MAYMNVKGKDYNFVRASVLGVAEYNDKILVEENIDRIKNLKFYRPLGGGIDFWEDSKEALKREFKEELKADIEIIEYICTLENRFIFENVKRHEILTIYRIKLPSEFYIKDEYLIDENGMTVKARWVKKDCFINEKLALIPKELSKYL